MFYIIILFQWFNGNTTLLNWSTHYPRNNREEYPMKIETTAYWLLLKFATQRVQYIPVWKNSSFQANVYIEVWPTNAIHERSWRLNIIFLADFLAQNTTCKDRFVFAFANFYENAMNYIKCAYSYLCISTSPFFFVWQRATPLIYGLL